MQYVLDKLVHSVDHPYETLLPRLASEMRQKVVETYEAGGISQRNTNLM